MPELKLKTNAKFVTFSHVFNKVLTFSHMGFSDHTATSVIFISFPHTPVMFTLQFKTLTINQPLQFELPGLNGSSSFLSWWRHVSPWLRVSISSNLSALPYSSVRGHWGSIWYEVAWFIKQRKKIRKRDESDVLVFVKNLVHLAGIWAL